MPAILMSICIVVMPSDVPATLKSMSPRWSSSPKMSERIAIILAFEDEAHGDARNRAFDGDASVHHRKAEPPQTEAIDDEPFDSVMSLVMRMV